MSSVRGQGQPKVCPKTGRIIRTKSKLHFLKWLFPITGLFALIWFLIRVIPKPSRATYPCQRVAFPVASSFIVWLLGALGSIAAFHKAKRSLAKARYAVAILCIVASIGFVWLAMSAASSKEAKAVVRAAQTANDPNGVARGINPGRVAWIHDANATNWAYVDKDQTEHWYENAHTDQGVVNKMMSEALRSLTGEESDAAAWDAIFRYFNQQQGKGDVGYQAGEKIGIKTNNTLCFGSDPCVMDKSDGTYWHEDPPFDQCIDNSPQLTIALLKQLTDVVGVAPGDISIGDPGRIMPNYWYDMVEANCPGVVYIAAVGGKGRTQSQFSDVEFHWSDPCVNPIAQDYIPTCFAEADYFINFPLMKDHTSGGITACGKNLYGSLIRNPTGALNHPGYQSYPDPDWEQDDYYPMHASLPGPADPFPGVSDMGSYRCLVDLMSHPQLGGKTVLYLADALFAARGWDGVPYEWLMPPFGDGASQTDWPNSIFLSQDGVAIDSVCFDFMLEEWPYESGVNMEGSDDYLHELALIPDPCSGTNYDPNDDGGLTESQGVHEHWNNATDKQYTRNLGTGDGIELSTEVPASGDFDDSNDVDFYDFAAFAATWGAVKGDGNFDPNCDISTPSDGVIDIFDMLRLSQSWCMGK